MKNKQKFLSILCVVFVILKECRAVKKETYTVGIIFNELPSQCELPLNDTIIRTNIIEKEEGVSLASNTQVASKIDIFDTSKLVCNLIDDGIVAVLGPPGSPSSPVIESTCKSLNVPYIMTSWRKTNWEESEVFLNFHPDADKLAKGIAEIVKSLQWVGIIILYEEEEGLVKLQEVLKLQNLERTDKQDFIRVQHLTDGPDYRMNLPQSENHQRPRDFIQQSLVLMNYLANVILKLRPLFKKFRNTTENNIILDCKTENIIPILSQAKSLNMLDIRYNYFLTSLDAHAVDYSQLNLTANITTIRIFDYNSEEFLNAIQKWTITAFEFNRQALDIEPEKVQTETALFHDALTYLSATLKDLKSLHNAEVNCFGMDTFESGPEIIKTMREKDNLPTITGPIKFDDYGNREDFNIFVHTLDEHQLIATYNALNETLTLARTSEETALAATSNLKKVKVMISTRIGDPFLMEVQPKGNLQGNDRYEGYTKDLMNEIAKLMDFSFELHITKGNEFGKYLEDEKRWNGLIGDLLEQRAHLAVCDLTITHQRQTVVDFSMPFMTLGISILHKYPKRDPDNPFAFLDPFATSVWIYSATLYLLVTVIQYFITRMTPGDWVRPIPWDDNAGLLENMWGLQNCSWATMASIMNQGCDILPKGISSRFALSWWWFFALIITNSYMANLTAFLTKANLDGTIKDAQDLAKQTKIKYGCLEGGSTEQFFKESNDTIFSRMYTNMKSQRPSVLEHDNIDGVNRVLNDKKGRYAFLMESTQIEYHVETKCDLKQIGDWLDSKSYGIAMPMNANYRGSINKAILELQENQKLNELKQKWWKEKRKEPSCEKLRNADKENDNGELDVARTSGIFLVLGVGVAIGVAMGLLEFLWNVRNVSVEEHLTYWEALKIELKFAVHFWIKKKKVKAVSSEASSSSGKSEKSGKSGKSDIRSIIPSILQNATSFINLNTS